MALAAVYCALSVSFCVRKSLTRFCSTSRVWVSFFSSSSSCWRCGSISSICCWAAALRDRASLARSSRLAESACLAWSCRWSIGVLELLLLELEALLRRGEVDQRAAHLGDLLEHLLVGEVEHLVGLLGRVERLVRLGLHDVVCPLEDAHGSLPEGSIRHPHHRFDSSRLVWPEPQKLRTLRRRRSVR